MAEPRIHAPELDHGVAWLNTAGPLRLADLRGQVVVLDFFTYCCINCLHVLPVLEAIERRFADEPVAVIGVHTGKFTAEKDPRRVARAVARYGIRHPVVVDSEGALWSRYAVRSWPTLVIVRPDGTIAGSAAGEPDEDALAAAIRVELEAARGAGQLSAVRRPRPRRAPPDDATLAFPGGIATDASGGIWLSDTAHHRVLGASRDGVVHTVVGTGEPGLRDGALSEARLASPHGLVTDAAGARIYVADTGNHVIRRIDLQTGQIDTVAGTGSRGHAPPRGPRPARGQALRSPWDVALDEYTGALYLAMAGAHQVWRLDLGAGGLEVLAGGGPEALRDGDGPDARFAQPSGLALSPDRRRLYVADSESSAVRMIDLATRRVSTLVGTGLFDFGYIDGPAERARLQHCLGVAVTPAGVAVADTYNNAIRGINPRHHSVTTIWGGAEPALEEPGALAIDRADASYLVADTNHHRLLRIARDGMSAREVELQFPG